MNKGFFLGTLLLPLFIYVVFRQDGDGNHLNFQHHYRRGDDRGWKLALDLRSKWNLGWDFHQRKLVARCWLIHFHQQTEKNIQQKHTRFLLIFAGENDWTPLVFFCVKSCCFKHRELRQSEKFTGKDLPCSNDLRRNITLWIWTSMPRNLGQKRWFFWRWDVICPGWKRSKKTFLVEKTRRIFLGWKISTWSLYKLRV